MRDPSQTLRASSDEKLKVILDQLARVRSRVNVLALQRALFTSLALVIGGAAILVLAALAFGPLTFLAVAIMLAALLAFGLIRAIKSSLHARVDTGTAASLADRRVDFKGRLTTLVALAGRGESSLWPYLLEETLSLRQEFDLSRVERRRVSRSLYALLGSGVLAGLAAMLMLAPGKLGLAAKAPASREARMPADNLQVRPSDPALDQDAEVNGDASATEKLAEREPENADNAPPGGGDDQSSKLLEKARDFASALQSKLTGRKPEQRPKMKMRLAEEPKDRSKSGSARQRPDSQTAPERLADKGTGGNAQQDKQGSEGSAPDAGSGSPPSQQTEEPSRDGLASNKPMTIPEQASPPAGNNFPNGSAEPGPSRNGGAGGASHGAGTDPQHLFGRADKPPTGKDGFSITLEARLSENGPAAGDRGYVPPKVRSSLNSDQQPDEPLSRGAVPADDRQTIKRVFER